MKLTEGDLKKIKKLIKASINSKLSSSIENSMGTKSDFPQLLSRDDFYRKTDEVLGEIKKIREEWAVIYSKLLGQGG